MRHFWTGIASAFSLSGCASLGNTLLNRPITSDHLEEAGEGEKLKTISGDRRLVRVSLLPGIKGTDQSRNIYRICAETQADAIASRTGASGATLAERGSFTDSMTEELILTNQRGQISDVVRQLAWNWCNAQMNGMLDKGVYQQQMIELQNAAFEALKAPPEKPEKTEKADGAKPKETPKPGAKK